MKGSQTNVKVQPSSESVSDSNAFNAGPSDSEPPPAAKAPKSGVRSPRHGAGWTLNLRGANPTRHSHGPQRGFNLKIGIWRPESAVFSR